jgi:hypothetical protein
MEFEISSSCTCKTKDEGAGPYILPPVLLFVLAILGFMVYFLLSNIDSSGSSKIYIVLLLIVCASVSIVLILVIIRILKRAFVTSILKD